MVQEIHYTLANLEATAEQLVQQFGHIPIWTLTGDLGAGKTTLSTAIAKALNSLDEVSSPTYAIVNEYQLSDNTWNYQRMSHMDLYRLNDEAEVYDAGILELIDQAHTFTLIEWPQIAARLLPNNILSLNIHSNIDNSRTIKITHQ